MTPGEPLAPTRPPTPSEPLRRKAVKARALMGPAMLLYLYRRRLRVHAVQELVTSFSDGELRDDVTMLAVRVGS